MKECFILLFYLVSVFKLNAQQNEKAIGSVSYQFLHKRDTLSENFYEERMGLVFSKQSAVYFSLNVNARDSAMKKITDDQMMKATSGGRINIDMRNLPSASPGAYYSFYQEQKATILRPYIKVDYMYDQSLSTINWNISDESKEIGGFKCQKASGICGGRLYEAWFCSEIPVSTGPWKLHGLPGLILEAVDSSSQVKFLFQSFSTTNFYGKSTVALPAQAEKTTKEEFEKMMKAMRENPQEALRGIVSEGSTFTITKITPPPRNLFNNPLELPEKEKKEF